ALTDDVHAPRHASRWNVPPALATIGAAESERTATVVWNVLDGIPHGVFLWNVFPLHPHEANTPFSNRQHNSLERKAGVEIMIDLVRRLKPVRIVAIGNDAADAARKLDLSIPVLPVRHPSYGGQRQFVAQMAAVYGAPSRRHIDLL
ncbi:MAG: uracil-DNA glycosylase, partial [Vicinamibacterales bacterium]